MRLKIILSSVLSIGFFFFSISLILVEDYIPVFKAFYACNIVYIIFTICLIRFAYEIKRRVLLLIISLPIILLLGPIHIYHFSDTYLSLTRTVSMLMGIAVGYWVGTKHSNKSKILLLIMNGGLLFLFWTQVYPILVNKMNYGNFSQVIEEKIPTFSLITEEKVNFSNVDLKNKTVIFDFWNSRCGVCYRNFPAVDSIYKNNKNTDLYIYAVNVPIMNETVQSNIGRLTKMGYSMPNLYAEGIGTAEEVFGIHVYPTTIVIRNNRIIFRGKFLNAYKHYLKIKKDS